MRIRGLIFDMDGTILDTSEFWNSVPERYLLSKEKIAEEGLSKKLFPMTLQEGAKYLRAEYGLKESTEKIVKEIRDMIREYYYDKAQTKPGAEEFVRFCSSCGYLMTVATSSEKELVEAALERLNLRTCFGEIVTAAMAGEGKQNPKVYELAMQKMGTTPGETLVIEDALFAIRTAKYAGFHTLGVYDEGCADEWEEICKTADWSFQELKQCRDFVNSIFVQDGVN